MLHPPMLLLSHIHAMPHEEHPPPPYVCLIWLLEDKHALARHPYLSPPPIPHMLFKGYTLLPICSSKMLLPDISMYKEDT